MVNAQITAESRVREMMSTVTLPQVLSIMLLCGLAVADLSVIAILVVRRKKLAQRWFTILVILAVILTLVFAGLLGLSIAAGSNHPIAPPQPYPLN